MGNKILFCADDVGKKKEKSQEKKRTHKIDSVKGIWGMRRD